MAKWDAILEDPRHLIDLDNLDEEVRHIGAKIAYIGTQLAEAEYEANQYKEVLIPEFNAKWWQRYYRDDNPRTGKPYSADYIDSQRRLQPENTEIKQKWLEMVKTVGVLKAHYDSLLVQAKLLTAIIHQKKSQEIYDNMEGK